MKKAAHFLLIPELFESPPNKALINAYLSNGYAVDVYAPWKSEISNEYGAMVRCFPVGYTWTWIYKNILSLKWFQYSILSGTSEDPLGIVGLLAFLYRKRSISLVDEIKAGSYRGDRSNIWKDMCKWGIANSNVQIVNDRHRIQLLIDYIGFKRKSHIIVYPGCYMDRPESTLVTRDQLREKWGFEKDAFVIGSSGGFNMTAGADWLLQCMEEQPELFAVIQPLGVSDLEKYLLGTTRVSDRIYIENNRLSWHDAWISSTGLDVGICIYKNPAPQFQQMGISSNRLCMFIAMGVPVIASRQGSFQFIEDFNCGVLVDNASEFTEAVRKIRNNLAAMKSNCEDCFNQYIKPGDYFRALCSEVGRLMP